jgi:hypothetical protein
LNYCEKRGRQPYVAPKARSKNPEVISKPPEAWEKEGKSLKWGSLFIPAGTPVRMFYNGRCHEAKIGYARIVDDGLKYSPAQWASKVANNTSRSAPRDLEIFDKAANRWRPAAEMLEEATKKFTEL